MGRARAEPGFENEKGHEVRAEQGHLDLAETITVGVGYAVLPEGQGFTVQRRQPGVDAGGGLRPFGQAGGGTHVGGKDGLWQQDLRRRGGGEKAQGLGQAYGMVRWGRLR